MDIVGVCQGKRGPFISSTGQNTHTRAKEQKTAGNSAVTCPGRKWQGDEWYWWVSRGQTLQGFVSLRSWTLPCMGRVLSRWISSDWERNHEGSGTAMEIDKRPCRRLWNFIQQVSVEPSNISGNILGAVDKTGQNPVLCGVQHCCSLDKTRRAWPKLVRMERRWKWQHLVTH